MSLSRGELVGFSYECDFFPTSSFLRLFSLSITRPKSIWGAFLSASAGKASGTHLAFMLRGKLVDFKIYDFLKVKLVEKN